MNTLDTHIPEPPSDLAERRDTWLQAADAGNVDAMYALGYLHAEWVQPPDLDTARHWYEQAAEAGNTDAMVALMTLYLHKVRPRNKKAAKQWLQRAYAAGHDMSTVCGPSFRQRLGLRLYRLADTGRKLEQWGTGDNGHR
jgi:TPR repeat protein